MIRATVLDKFVRTQGYEIVKRKGISEASRVTEISRPTIYAILKRYPEPPSKTFPKYVYEWEQTTGRQVFFEKNNGGKLDAFDRMMSFGMKCWKDVLHFKDPISWSAEDFRKIWSYEPFFDEVTGKIRCDYAVFARKWMRTIGQAELCELEEFKIKGLKRPKGMRKMWFLEDDEIRRLIKACHRSDILVFNRMAMESFGRASSVLRVRPMDLNYEKSGILMCESKVRRYVLRYFNPCSMRFFKRYIEDHKIPFDSYLFPSYSTICKRLKQVAKTGDIPKLATMRGSTHIWKHTGITQGAYHGLSMEVLSDQSGTDPNTLRDFYAGIKEQKLRAELLGEKLNVVPYHEWVKSFDPLWNEQYEKLGESDQACHTL